MHNCSRADSSPQRCNSWRNTSFEMQMVFANCTAKKLVDPSSTMSGNSRVRGGRQSGPGPQQFVQHRVWSQHCSSPPLWPMIREPAVSLRRFTKKTQKKPTKYFPFQQVQSRFGVFSDHRRRHQRFLMKTLPGRSGVYRAANTF